MAKFNKKKYNKPLRYTTRDGKWHTEHMPRDWPEWFYAMMRRWLWRKQRQGRPWYYYEIRLTLNHPFERKFDDLWFLDHLERDHTPANPPLWHEKLLKHWLMRLYGHDINWFEGMVGEYMNKREYIRYCKFGYRYYPIQFNSKMRLVYHGCAAQEYFDAFDRKVELIKEAHIDWAKERARDERRLKRRKAKEAKEKKA